MLRIYIYATVLYYDVWPVGRLNRSCAQELATVLYIGTRLPVCASRAPSRGRPERISLFRDTRVVPFDTIRPYTVRRRRGTRYGWTRATKLAAKISPTVVQKPCAYVVACHVPIVSRYDFHLFGPPKLYTNREHIVQRKCRVRVDHVQSARFRSGRHCPPFAT